MGAIRTSSSRISYLIIFLVMQLLPSLLTLLSSSSIFVLLVECLPAQLSLNKRSRSGNLIPHMPYDGDILTEWDGRTGQQIQRWEDDIKNFVQDRIPIVQKADRVTLCIPGGNWATCVNSCWGGGQRSDGLSVGNAVCQSITIWLLLRDSPSSFRKERSRRLTTRGRLIFGLYSISSA